MTALSELGPKALKRLGVDPETGFVTRELSVRELAELTGIPAGTIHRWTTSRGGSVKFFEPSKRGGRGGLTWFSPKQVCLLVLLAEERRRDESEGSKYFDLREMAQFLLGLPQETEELQSEAARILLSQPADFPPGRPPRKVDRRTRRWLGKKF